MLRHTLSLTLVLLSFASAHAVNGDFGVNDYQRVAWKWSDEKASLGYCVQQFGYQKGNTVSIMRDKREVYHFDARPRTVFVIEAERLFIATFGPGCFGCRVRAVDLKTGQELWVAGFKEVGPAALRTDNNRMNIECDGNAIAVWVNEARGRYVRFLHPKTGETLGHKDFKRE